MRAKEAIPAFAEKTGLTVGEVKVVDRALADHGLRAKGRGPTPPEMSKADAIRLLLGLAGANVSSRANEYVADAQNFTVFGPLVPAVDPKRFKDTLGIDEKRIAEMKLIYVLVTICTHLASKPEEPASQTTLILNVEQNGPVSIFFDDGKEHGEVVFNGVLNSTTNYAFRRSVEVGKSILRWIGQSFPDDHESNFADLLVR